MDNIAGQKTSLGLVTNLTVAILVILWLIPTVGLLVSSFPGPRPDLRLGLVGGAVPGGGGLPHPRAGGRRGRGRRRIPARGQHLRHRGSAGGVRPRAPAPSPPSATRAGTRAPTPTGEVADLGDGETLQVNPDGTFVYTSAEEIDRGPRIYFGAEAPPEFTLDNYETVLTSAGMDRAFINTLTVTIPATVIPILIAAFAAYALAWMDFPGRGVLIARRWWGCSSCRSSSRSCRCWKFHNEIGIGQSFVGIWFAHTAFGMPLAVYLLRNYMVGLPRDIIESAKVDGATDFQVFTKIVLPLSFPALAAFAIFQFLWTWNDLLVAKVFLPQGDTAQVMTVKIADDLLGSRGGDWGILATAAFVSIAVPIVVFFSMQRFLVRGLLAGSVK